MNLHFSREIAYASSLKTGKETYILISIAFQETLSAIGDRYAVQSSKDKFFYKQVAPTEHYLLRRSLLFVAQNSKEPSLRRSRPFLTWRQCDFSGEVNEWLL